MGSFGADRVAMHQFTFDMNASVARVIMHCHPTSGHVGLELSALLRSVGLVLPAEFAVLV